MGSTQGEPGGTGQDSGQEVGQTLRPVLHRTVVMVGMMGSGKTAVGRALGQRLSVPFLDSDAEIETAAHASIAEIFARDGEPFFRRRESEVIGRLLAGPPCILSTGGGAYLAARNRDAIAAHGVAVWLNAPLDLLWERVRHKDSRPLLRTTDPRATLAQIHADRTPVYAEARLHLAVQSRASIEETTDSVIALLLTDPTVLEMLP
ncbi:shikimate kinase [Loktanella fryxellensis]|uniref:Shikimate kinase n=1 Tax=Loktanella fryxellensis TaxID=245187 RepID=A0A1H8IDS3_9RHOB|nr:shikimate kinase [Loktanella fryxellensis]SEN66953.1 shikimate kinase [Loktanella fryxellensis]